MQTSSIVHARPRWWNTKRELDGYKASVNEKERAANRKFLTKMPFYAVLFRWYTRKGRGEMWYSKSTTATIRHKEYFLDFSRSFIYDVYIHIFVISICFRIPSEFNCSMALLTNAHTRNQTSTAKMSKRTKAKINCKFRTRKISINFWNLISRWSCVLQFGGLACLRHNSSFATLIF